MKIAEVGIRIFLPFWFLHSDKSPIYNICPLLWNLRPSSFWCIQLMLQNFRPCHAQLVLVSFWPHYGSCLLVRLMLSQHIFQQIKSCFCKVLKKPPKQIDFAFIHPWVSLHRVLQHLRKYTLQIVTHMLAYQLLILSFW